MEQWQENRGVRCPVNGALCDSVCFIREVCESDPGRVQALMDVIDPQIIAALFGQPGAFDRAVTLARSEDDSGMEEPTVADALKPQTFEELLAVTEATKGCARCAKLATHKVTLSATKLHTRSPDGRKSGPPPGQQVAKHGGYLCESCAVGVYAKFREIVR